MDGKRCSKCGITKPYSEFGKNKNTKDKLNFWCRQCNRESTAKWIKSYPDKYKETYQRWQNNNQEKIRASTAARNKEKCAENSRKYRAAHPEKISQYCHEWRINNPNYDAEYRISHKEYILTWFANHRAKKKKAPGKGVTYAEFFEKYGKKCLCCGSEDKIEMDHVVPITRGGAHDIANVQPLCRHCNASKGIKIIDYRMEI